MKHELYVLRTEMISDGLMFYESGSREHTQHTSSYTHYHHKCTTSNDKMRMHNSYMHDLF